MPELKLHFFISATSSDLGTFRLAVRDELIERSVFPIAQDDFQREHRKTIDILRDQIERCDAVICLIGFAYVVAQTDANSDNRSYIQLEYDLAPEIGKPIYAFFANLSVESDKPTNEPAKLRTSSSAIARRFVLGAWCLKTV